jgi:NADH-quinone oxidoreductase subunit H
MDILLNHIPHIPWMLFLYSFVICSTYCYAYIHRKLRADLQARVGPRVAGKFGLLQPLADYLKCIRKQRSPLDFQKTAWIYLISMFLFSTIVVLPITPSFLFSNYQFCLFLLLLSILVLCLGWVLIEIEEPIFGWFRSIRFIQQSMISILPALISILCVGLTIGSFEWEKIAQHQGFMPWNWVIFYNVFTFFNFFVFLVSGLIASHFFPLDAAIRDSHAIGSAFQEFSGKRYLFFLFARYYCWLFWNVATVVLYLGAWKLPTTLEIFLQNLGLSGMVHTLELLFIFSKTMILMLTVHWVSESMPKPRVDQIAYFAWTVLIPIALMSTIGCTLWVGWKFF